MSPEAPKPLSEAEGDDQISGEGIRTNMNQASDDQGELGQSTASGQLARDKKRPRIDGTGPATDDIRLPDYKAPAHETASVAKLMSEQGSEESFSGNSDDQSKLLQEGGQEGEAQRSQIQSPTGIRQGNQPTSDLLSSQSATAVNMPEQNRLQQNPLSVMPSHAQTGHPPVMLQPITLAQGMPQAHHLQGHQQPLQMQTQQPPVLQQQQQQQQPPPQYYAAPVPVAALQPASGTATTPAGAIPPAPQQYAVVAPGNNNINATAAQLMAVATAAGISPQQQAMMAMMLSQQQYATQMTAGGQTPVAMAVPNMNGLDTSGNGRRGPILYMPTDDSVLSDYQILLRKQIEFFETPLDDVGKTTSGRRRPIMLNQVGIQCRHCAGIPARYRQKGAVYYPAKLSGIYQAAQNMAGTHMTTLCQHMDVLTKEQLVSFQKGRSSTGHGGKQYWAGTAKAQGVAQTEDGGLRFLGTVVGTTPAGEASTINGSAPPPPPQQQQQWQPAPAPPNPP